MKKVLLFTALALGTTFASAADIKGSGASFPYSVYQSWIKAYHSATQTQVDYVKKGSSSGIKDIKARAVDFAGSDAPLNPNQLEKAKLYQFPAVVGAVVISYNVPNAKDLKISREALAEIALGKVKYWDNELIKKTNPNVDLPHKKLTFVHRADGSGTTFNFTYYLSKISKEWRKSFGAKKSLNWPGDHHIGGKTNTGVAALVKQTPYSIGYIDYADAKNNNLHMAVVENKEGHYIKPELKAFQAAAAKADLDPKKDFYSVIADPAGKNAYPIVAATFILLPKEKAQTNKEVTAFYNYSFKNSAKLATELGFVPLPDSLTDKIRKYWSEKGVM
ncbi:phosphate ABC transporter substrate-binding protein PstS [Malaciobacter molluscorum LMG 25693]|uniref:Phosphate-binding protein n=1 Tax=Malaciobacter molluscorum LMG 25693 TaxID=870501 RepID=A0A2G1DKT8_9BACT|nr:phosphate ABC transporter substrate-binding protein PstS [Malaciobacter molluscorum]AXX92705.1 phosphate ABC transporter, periplasmic phosphate-binding protein [Malaciobacter molluscorum LMG 25693]PHO19122.1 phosphate ABC transporter substrate-binding protein PstS [Malaciobacter molluscorum LMG 25693]RXJ97436.1 phosphate ABC transporter substrate-binding protein PstS [Malaciobacter molluscorum]